MQIISFLFFFIVLLFSAIIHEYAHGWMAEQLGDMTAKLSGRLTLNPIAHIDPIGTILVPLILYLTTNGAFLFAWAKPVPYNPFHLKDPEKDAAKIAIAGPIANLIIALIFGTLARILPSGNMTEFFLMIVYINILLAVFNLVPIPPLDGSKILFAALPEGANNIKIFLSKYGFFIFLIFIFFGFDFILPIIFTLFRIITGRIAPF